MLQKTILRAVGVVTVLIVATYIQILDHDWQTFGRNAVALRLNERYDTNDPDAVLDVYYPSEVENTERTLPTVVWVHGGSFISGSKDQIANYLRALAAKNYTVVGVNYSLAPAKIYPTPILQVNAALAFLSKNGAGLHVDASKFFLA